MGDTGNDALVYIDGTNIDTYILVNKSLASLQQRTLVVGVCNLTEHQGDD